MPQRHGPLLVRLRREHPDGDGCPPSSTEGAGKPARVCPADDPREGAREHAVRQVRRPGRQAAALERGRRLREGLPLPRAQPRRSSSRSLPSASICPCRRARGTSRAGARAPCPGRRRRPEPASPACRPARGRGPRAAAPRAGSGGPGRRGHGPARARAAGAAAWASERMSSVTSSSRSPGTCQSNSSASTWLRTARGISTVTPSVGDPGSNGVPELERELARVPGVGVVRPGPPGSRDSASSSSGVNVSRSGSVRRALLPPAVEVRADTTSGGIRAS